jgi:hypothetical protein
MLRKFHDLMAQESPAAAAPTPGGLTVAEIIDKYLDFLQTRVSDGPKAERTYEWHHNHIQDFLNRRADTAHLPAIELQPFHVVEWADSQGEARSNADRRGGIVAIHRPFNWAEELGYLPASSIKKIPKPQPQRREQAVSPDMWPRIGDHYAKGDPFRDLLGFA